MQGRGRRGEAAASMEILIAALMLHCRSDNPCDFIRLVRTSARITSSRSACSEGSSTRWTRSAGGSSPETTAGTISSWSPTSAPPRERLTETAEFLSSQNLGESLAALTRLCSTHRAGTRLRRCVERVEDAGFELRSFSEGLARAQMATTDRRVTRPRRQPNRLASGDDDETCGVKATHAETDPALPSLPSPKDTSASGGDHARLA